MRWPASFRDLRFWMLLGTTVVALVMGAFLKAPCLVNGWDSSAPQYRLLCYNDIQPLYYARHLNEDRIPYVQEFLEYPTLTGVVVYVAALLSPNDGRFFVWNAVFMALFALGTTAVLYHLAADKRRVLFFAASPALVLYAFHNWDLMAVFFASAALLAFTRGRPATTGVLVALGASAKIYPGLFLPILAVAVWRTQTDPWGRLVRLGASFAGTMVAVQGPFVIANPRLWWATYKFHLDRSATFESTWYALPHYAQKWGWGDLSLEEAKHVQTVIAVPVVLLGLGALVFLQWRRTLPAIPATLGFLLFFMILSRVFSVQYALWILPYFAMTRLTRAKFGVFEATDVASFIAIFTFLYHFNDAFNKYYAWVAVAVIVRAGALIWILAHVFRAGSRPSDARLRRMGGRKAQVKRNTI